MWVIVVTRIVDSDEYDKSSEEKVIGPFTSEEIAEIYQHDNYDHTQEFMCSVVKMEEPKCEVGDR